MVSRESKLPNFAQLPVEAQVVAYWATMVVARSNEQTKSIGPASNLSFKNRLEIIAGDFIANTAKLRRSTDDFERAYFRNRNRAAILTTKKLDEFKRKHSVPLEPLPEKYTLPLAELRDRIKAEKNRNAAPASR